MASDFKSTHCSGLKWVQIKAVSNEFKLKVVSNDFKVNAVRGTSQMCPSSRYVSKGFKVKGHLKRIHGHTFIRIRMVQVQISVVQNFIPLDIQQSKHL